MNEVDTYIAGVSPAVKKEFERMCSLILREVPSAEQGRSYGMAAYLYKGKPLISFVETKTHLSVYPFSGKVVDGVRARLEGYSLSSGTIRFSLERPIPDAVLKDVLAFRVREIEERAL